MNLFTNKWLHTIFACSIICCTSVYADKNKTKSRTPGFLFSESDRLLVGELPVSVVPLREEVMKAGLSGEIVLERPAGRFKVKAGQELGGIDLEKFKIQEKLLEIEEALLEELKMPQEALQRASEKNQLEERLAKLNAEIAILEKFMSDPQIYAKLSMQNDNLDRTPEESMASTQEELNKTKEMLSEMLELHQTDRLEKLRVEETQLKFENQKLQFEARKREVFLTAPFDGEVEILFPYFMDRPNYVAAGTELARITDKSLVFADLPVLDSDWRLIPKNLLHLEVDSARGPLRGRYHSRTQVSLQGQSKLCYRFVFTGEDSEALEPLFGGTVPGKLYCQLEEKRTLVPKFFLIAINPKLFREQGWPALISKMFPEFVLDREGLNHLALKKIP